MTDRARPYDQDALAAIRRNAGRMPAMEIANSLGWPLSRLQRIARDHGFDLKVPEARVEDPASVESRPSNRPHKDPEHLRSVTVSAALMPSDAQLIETIAAETGLRRGRVISRVIENARARDMLLELAKLPAPMPERTGNLDE